MLIVRSERRNMNMATIDDAVISTIGPVARGARATFDVKSAVVRVAR